MQNIKVLIVENELIVAEMLSHKLEEGGYTITGIVTSGEEVAEAVKQQLPDLVIMDIGLDGKMDGIEAAALLNKEVPVIFLTDYHNPETVKRAAGTGPAAYLLKPFNVQQVNVSIQQALYNASEGIPASLSDHSAPAKADPLVLPHVIFVRHSNNHYKKLLVSDICYIEADGAYCNIHLDSGEKYTYSISMNHIHEKIGHPLFVRVNRSRVVNLERVTAVKGNLLMLGDLEILVGETYREAVLKRIPLLR